VTHVGKRDEKLRRRLERERASMAERLGRMQWSPESDEAGVPGGGETALEEGDAAQASERRDMAFTSRERLVRRPARLTAALERFTQGTYGKCQICGQDIEAKRLTAVPEVETCLVCQECLERSGRAGEAAA
jgi:DnaK suppressor protein